VEFHHTPKSFMNISDQHFQQLLASKDERDKLFADISSYKSDGRIEAANKISLKKLIGYFTENETALYPGFKVHTETLNSAFEYTIVKNRKPIKQSKKNRELSNSTVRKGKKELHLTKALFHKFLPTLLLFTRLWVVFDAADKLVVEDQKVFRGEFLKIKDRLNNLHGILILGGISEEDWHREFDTLDKNNDGYATFDEVCNYALKHIKTPFDYEAEEEDDGEPDSEDDEFNETEKEKGDEGVQAAESGTFVEIIGLNNENASTATATPDVNAEAMVTAVEDSTTATTGTIEATAPSIDVTKESDVKVVEAAEVDTVEKPASAAAEEGEGAVIYV